MDSGLVNSADCSKIVILMSETLSVYLCDSPGLPWELHMQLFGAKYIFVDGGWKKSIRSNLIYVIAAWAWLRAAIGAQ